MSIKQLAGKLNAKYWTLGFVKNGLDGIMNDAILDVEWLKMPKDGWFADPFILDVTDDEVQVLVEKMLEDTNKGVITLLKIDRHTMELKSQKVVLELPTHLSFPCILRENSKVFIYPENAFGEKLNLYEYHSDSETVTYHSTLCDEMVWDSCITDRFDEKLLFTASHDDYILDIYKWDGSKNRFTPWKQIPSDNKNSRMGGQLFEYKGNIYYPAQDCNSGYGGAICIKQISCSNGDFSFKTVKRITSPHPKMKLGLHTINEYKGVVVVDVLGHRHPTVGRIVDWMVGIKKKNSNK